MALISRFSLLFNHSYKNVVFSNATHFSFHHYKCRILFPNLQFTKAIPHLQQKYLSTNKELKEKDVSSAKVHAGSKLSQKTRLKQAIRDYGSTIIVFHIAISLASLGLCYIAVSNGVDVVSLLTRVGFPESLISSDVAVGSSTFVMSYAVHKLFAPVRIAITLSAAPLIVRYLRRINILKPPK